MPPLISQKQVQAVILAPQLRQGLRLLAMGMPELRREILKEMSENPVIDDVDDGCENVEAAATREADPSDPADERGVGDGAVDVLGVAYLEGANRDMADPETSERRERFFASQVSEESLEEHLLKQIPVSDIDEKDGELVEMLIGELDADGYFRGSLRTIAEVSGTSEAHLRELLAKISYLDPPGCGATSLGECLLPQLDLIADEFLRNRVRGVLGRLNDIPFMKSVDREVVQALRMLNPRPGSAFRNRRYESEYVRPEVKAVRGPGGYRAVVDAQDMPTIRISKRCLRMLEDPAVDDKTKAYLRERLASVRGLIDAVDKRQETIAAIAQAIFDAQPEFFRGGLDALRPLTMQQVAKKVGVHHATVSRTVRGKYVATPKGVFELRQFFTSGVTTESGDATSMTAVMARLRDVIMAEDVARPLTDDILTQKLREFGYEVARRTVTKYRKRLGIPSATKRAVRG